MDDIFISYSRKDSDFVDKIIHELYQYGLSVWVDREDIRGGAAWRASISAGIRACDVFIIVLSNQSVESVNVTKELALADKHKKPIIPILYRTCEIPTGMEYQLAGLQVLDFSRQRFALAMDQLIASLPERLTSSAHRSTLHTPRSPEKVKKSPSKSDHKKRNRIFVLVGIVGVFVVGVCLCVVIVQQYIPVQPTQEVAVIDPAESIPTPYEIPASVNLSENPSELQEELSYYLSDAIQAEVLAYRYENILYAEEYFYGDILTELKNSIAEYNQQGLINVEYFDAANSYIVEARKINENKLEIDTCEYWQSALYDRQTGALHSSSPVTLIPQTITLEHIDTKGLLITEVIQHQSQSFCR